MIIEKNKMNTPASSCQRFIQNAWKKELCSNCFKPKEEHTEPKIEINTKLTWSLNDLPPPASILKSSSRQSKSKTFGVKFNSEESEVIGYGGNDEFSDDDDDFFNENPKYEGEDLPDSEYEKELLKLTKANTDFNSIIENLNRSPSENVKPISPLKLGRPDLNQTSSKPIQISVQPFGANTTNDKIKPLANNTILKNHNLNSTTASTLPDGVSKILNSKCNIEIDSKKNVTVTETTNVNNSKYNPVASVNDSTLKSSESNPNTTNKENTSKSSCSITLRDEKDEKINLLNSSDSQKVAQLTTNNVVSISKECTSPSKLLTWKSLNDQKTESDKKTDNLETKTSEEKTKVLKNDTNEFCDGDVVLNQVQRNNSATSTESSKSRKCLQRGNIITKSHEIVKSKIVQQVKEDLNDTFDSLLDTTDEDKLVTEHTQKTDNILKVNNVTHINIDTKHYDAAPAKTNNIFASKHAFLNKDLCEKINSVISKNKSKLEISNKDTTSFTNPIFRENANDWSSAETVDCKTAHHPKDIVSASGNADSTSDSSLDESMYKLDREKIGEPDGKADSDSSEISEPPELPKVPPPNVLEDEKFDETVLSSNNYAPPRPSFLHNKKVKNNENLCEPKPKIGIKPNGLLFSIPQQFSSPTTKLNGFLNNGSKDIKINSLKIQSNYVELKKKNSDYDFINFNNKNETEVETKCKNNIYGDKISMYQEECQQKDQQSTPVETYKYNGETSTNSCRSNEVNLLGHASTADAYKPNVELTEQWKLNEQNIVDTKTSNPNKSVELGLNEMIDSKIIFDKEYENVSTSDVKRKSEHIASRNEETGYRRSYNKSFSHEDNLTYANFNDAIDRLNGLEEKFNPMFNYSISRSNSYDENLSDCVTSRCETPIEMRTKRQAPKPPPTPPLSSQKTTTFGTPVRSSKPPVIYPKPELDMVTPPPRKSSSTDCLAEKYNNTNKFAKKIGSSTAATRMRHTLKKYLRLGKEDVDFTAISSPAPRPRPQIIHPIDLNKSGVEVLKSTGSKDTEEEIPHGMPGMHQIKARPSKPPPPPRSHSLTEFPAGDPRDYENILIKTNPVPEPATAFATASTNPASNVLTSTACSDVPRSLGELFNNSTTVPIVSASETSSSNLSLPLILNPTSMVPETSCLYTPTTLTSSFSHSPSIQRTYTTSTPNTKPARPPPPKSAEYLKRQSNLTNMTSSVYNDVGSQLGSNGTSSQPSGSIPPVKPQRTASLRDQKKIKTNAEYEIVASSHSENENKKDSTSEIEHNVYELLELSNGDSEPPSPSSDGSSSGQRSLSYQYAGSETESDIYYPYVFYSNEEGIEEDGWKGSRVRVRKNRNVVHKSLEDNYGAVVITNHEALAQVLEQMNHNFISTPSNLKSLKTSTLRFRDFNVCEDTKLAIGDRKYYIGDYGGLNVVVSLCISQCSFLHTKSLPPCFILTPVCEFMENVQSKFISSNMSESLQQVSVAILPCLQICTLTMYLKSSCMPSSCSENSEKDLGLILIQLVNAVKSLQACGIEETTESLEEFLLCQEDKNILPRLCVLPVSDQNVKRISLCQCVSQAIELLLPHSSLTPLLKEILSHEKSTSLSQSKSVIEFWLWGPDDVNLNEEKQIALQRWLDLDRATTLHSLVCSRPLHLSPQDYSHLQFLVRTNSKCLMDAFNVLKKFKAKQDETETR